MAQAGRPREIDRDELLRDLEAYIEKEDMPIIAEFSYTRNIPRQMLYDMPELSDALKKAIAKKETYLEKKALSGDVNVTMAIFSLKQMGWKDRQEMSFDQDDNPIRIQVDHSIDIKKTDTVEVHEPRKPDDQAD